MRDGVLLARETPAGLAARTGTEDIEEAFLRLIGAPADRVAVAEP